MLARETPWAAVVNVIRSLSEPLLEDVEFMSQYTGDQIEADSKSLALSLSFRHPERTLRTEEVTEALERIVSALADQLGAVLRAE